MNSSALVQKIRNLCRPLHYDGYSYSTLVTRAGKYHARHPLAMRSPLDAKKLIVSMHRPC